MRRTDPVADSRRSSVRIRGQFCHLMHNLSLLFSFLVLEQVKEKSFPYLFTYIIRLRDGMGRESSWLQLGFLALHRWSCIKVSIICKFAWGDEPARAGTSRDITGAERFSVTFPPFCPSLFSQMSKRSPPLLCFFPWLHAVDTPAMWGFACCGRLMRWATRGGCKVAASKEAEDCRNPDISVDSIKTGFWLSIW